MEARDQEILDKNKQQILDKMMEKLGRILERDQQMREKLEVAASTPNTKNVQELMKVMDGIRVNLGQAMIGIQKFQQEVTFFDHPQFPIPQDLLSPKVGLVQHAVIQQIEKIDSSQANHYNRYRSLNQQLSQKIHSINTAIDTCLRNLNQKL